MKIIGKDITDIKEPLAVAIGFFDGVHRGHHFLLGQLVEEAKKRSLASAVVTFERHPRATLHSSFQPALLCSYEERIEYLATTGVEYCISLDFTEELSLMSAKEFMQQILKDKYNVDTLLIGYDHRFGFNRTDGLAEYVQYGEKIGIHVVLAKELDSGDYISSSHIRKLLKSGEVEEVSHLLGYNYRLSGKTISGNKIGHTIGYPTANLEPDSPFKVLPAIGVYAAYVYIKNVRYKGMAYIGKRPTLHESNDVSVEINIFDFNADLYGEKITIEFLKFMRKDTKFQSVEILRKQLEFDEKRIRKYFEEM